MLENKFNIPQSDESEYLPFLIPSVHRRMLLMADIHTPYHCVSAIDTMFEFCQDKKIDSVLLNGDFMDFYQLSKFMKDPRRKSFSEELHIGNEMLDSLDMAFPKAKKFFKKGNHDERYEKYLKIKAPELIGVAEFSLDILLKLRTRGIEYIEDQIVWAGKLPILHGHELNMKSVTVNPARTLYLKAKCSAVCSHLHVPSNHKGKRLGDHIISTWSTGHLSDPHPEYARNNEWVHGFAIIDFDNEIFEVSNYQIIHNKVYRT